MKTHYTLQVLLTLEGPLLTSGSELSDVGVDAPMARDHRGRFMLPYSLIKGKVLDALRDLGTDQKWCQEWLGSKPAEGNFEPERGRLRFGDLHTEQAGEPGRVIERIQLAPETGAVAGQMLLMVQAPFTYGEHVVYRGKMDFIADAQEAQEVKHNLDMALRWVPAYGAYRTVGFGRTVQVQTELSKSASRVSARPDATGSVIPWRVKWDRPLCLVGRKHSQNHFESQEVVSGTVLKGAVAQMLREMSGTNSRDVTQGTEFPVLRQHFSNIRFSEIRPKSSNSPSRPVEPPLSIVTCPGENGRYYDVALAENPCLIKAATPAFMPDWKEEEFGTVRNAFGWPCVPRERRTRTAINEQTGRAQDQQLFSYGLVLPDRGEGDQLTAEYVWEGTIGLEKVDKNDREKVCEEINSLLQYGIVGIGKTRATGEITWLGELSPPAITSDHSAARQPGTNERWAILTLQTECLMTNPETLQRTDRSSSLEDAYWEYWKEVSAGSLQGVRFFARQSLYGGFVSRRAKGGPQGKYEPFLLTDRGSVFVLKYKESSLVEPLLKQWATQGLPTPSWAETRYTNGNSPLWQRCPYIRENGYGEVAVNLACHFDNSLSQATLSAGVAS